MVVARDGDWLQQIHGYPWFHSIDLGDGVVTPGSKSPELHKAEIDAFLGPVDLTGASVIDVGAWNGFYSFTAKRLGAARVLATDHFCWNHPDFRGRETFELAREALGVDVEMRDIDVPDISVEQLGTFDVVLFLGVFYHLYDPIDGLRRVASLVNDVLVLETRIDLRYEPVPAMRFYPGTELDSDATSWWGPNVPLLRDLLTGLGFNRIDITTKTPSTERAIVHAWKTDRRRAPDWVPPEPPRLPGRSRLAGALRRVSRRFPVE